MQNRLRHSSYAGVPTVIGGMSWASYWSIREPVNINATATGSTTVTVTWSDSAVSGADGYKVYADSTLKSTVAVGVQTASVSGLIADTTYVFKVVAYKASSESTGITDIETTLIAPTGITNLDLWLKSDIGLYQDTGKITEATADTDPIKVWEDQSGNSRDASTSDDAKRPLLKLDILNGKPSVRMDGSNDLLQTPSYLGAAHNKAFSIFWVIDGSDVAATKIYFSNGINIYGSKVIFDGSWCGRRIYTGNLATNTTNLLDPYRTTNKKKVYGYTYDGNHFRFYMGKSYIETNETNNIGLSGVLSVGNYSSAGFQWGWDLFEVVQYNKGLSTTEANKIIRYLATTYDLSYATYRMICAGDSLTYGFDMDDDENYPGIIDSRFDDDIDVINIGQTGATISNVSTLLGTLDTAKNAVMNGATQILALWCGTNDINAGTSGNDTYTAYAALASAQKALGFKVLCFTILPRGDGSKEVERQSFNALVRANYATIGDALVDVGASSYIGDNGDQDNLTYYNVDKVHLSHDGYEIVADLVETAINSL